MFLQQCPHCAHVNPTGSRFCNACGGPLDLAPCPKCGAINAAGDASCRDCGTRLAAPGEREPTLRREHETPPRRTASPDGSIDLAVRREAARDDVHPIPSPRRSPDTAALPARPASSSGTSPHDSRPYRRAPHAAMTLIAGSLIALALLALGYAWTLRHTLEREGAAPAPSAPVARAPAAAPAPAPETPAPRPAAAPAPPAPATTTAAPSAPAANTCPPAVAAMGLCRTYEASATRP